MFLLCRCGGLRDSIAALHGMGVGRYGLGDAGASFFTLAFDSSPIKGEGNVVGVVLLSARHCPSGLTSLRSRCASVCAFSAKA